LAGIESRIKFIGPVLQGLGPLGVLISGRKPFAGITLSLGNAQIGVSPLATSRRRLFRCSRSLAFSLSGMLLGVEQMISSLTLLALDFGLLARGASTPCQRNDDRSHYKHNDNHNDDDQNCVHGGEVPRTRDPQSINQSTAGEMGT
jgi:hypothetical protein